MNQSLAMSGLLPSARSGLAMSLPVLLGWTASPGNTYLPTVVCRLYLTFHQSPSKPLMLVENSLLPRGLSRYPAI